MLMYINVYMDMLYVLYHNTVQCDTVRDDKLD